MQGQTKKSIFQKKISSLALQYLLCENSLTFRNQVKHFITNTKHVYKQY